jgi:hypothetical protein
MTHLPWPQSVGLCARCCGVQAAATVVLEVTHPGLSWASLLLQALCTHVTTFITGQGQPVPQP